MSDMLKVLIADDEQSSRDIIENYVNKYCNGLNVVDKAVDAKDTIAKIKSLKPDLVFLDVEMPYGNAFDVLEQTEECDYQTIFITAFSDYAIKALNYSAAYYILKPISIEELINAVDKVKELYKQVNLMDIRNVLKSNLAGENIERIVLPNQQGFEILDIDNIVRISGSGNYSDIYLTDGKRKTISKSLKFFDSLEENDHIMRVHKSHIVNLKHISAYRRGRGGVLVMNEGSEVEVAVRMKKALLERLGL